MRTLKMAWPSWNLDPTFINASSAPKRPRSSGTAKSLLAPKRRRQDVADFLSVPAANVNKQTRIERPTTVAFSSIEVPTAPEDAEGLIGNTAKVKELRTWISDRITGRQTNNCLLITGPCGCGKATAIQLLCDELDLDLVEFELEARINPHPTVAQTSSQNGAHDRQNFDNEFALRNVAHVEAFKNVLLETRQMTMETSSRTRKLLLIKELPTALYKDPKTLTEFLESTLPLVQVLVVFSLSTIQSVWHINPLRIFQEEVLRTLNIVHIKFNAVPKTIMSKAVNKWLAKLANGDKLRLVGDIVEKAHGDIRAAICAVEMFKQHNGAIDLKFLNGEDPQVEMFHLIGKILYAKRDDKPSRAFSAAQSKLNANVRNDYRRYLPPKDQPERLVRSWPVNTPTLIDYVAEHELRLCKSARRTTRAYRDLCSMAQLNRIWLLRNDAIADRLMTQILIYSLAFNNSDVARASSFHTLGKSNANQSLYRRLNLRREFNNVYPAESLNNMIMFQLPFVARMSSQLSKEEARLIETLYPHVGSVARRVVEAEAKEARTAAANTIEVFEYDSW